ncbi:MAG: DUF1848 domain-containing protein [Deltaproteobacteria bacterium]|nr:DUF1848 domain-containing protein [Deltaproteobacteria bacterium]MBW2122538.1 DUF1848 domain-containing protein [Deltaproteobacteria bacterium]
MIVSASRRTDIPAFYTAWLMNRVRSGFALVRNPFRPGTITRVSLNPAEVDAIVFWTRNAEPLIPYLDELDAVGYRYYFQYTLVHYPRAFERAAPPRSRKVDGFRRLSRRIGPARVIWRYDPIILSNLTGLEYHKKQFTEIARALEGFSQRCVISFLDIYRKTKRTLERMEKERGVRVIDLHERPADVREIAGLLAPIARQSGFEITTCAEPLDLQEYGIQPGRCIDGDLINRLFGLDLKVEKDKGQRKWCRCVESTDIGAYDTCPHGCIYCYANASLELARRNFNQHNSLAPMLG